MQFHLGDILSVTTERLLSPQGMSGLYEILNFMTNDNLYTHQLGRAAEECKPYLLEQMPWLTEIDVDGVNSDNFKWWIKGQVEKYGEYHEVIPIHFEDHTVIDPLDELKTMVGESKIITIDLTETEEPPSSYGDINWKVDNET